ncbi:MAG: hypothetical protein Q9174_005036 [Haloplaca sp. 1 TL-2023]
MSVRALRRSSTLLKSELGRARRLPPACRQFSAISTANRTSSSTLWTSPHLRPSTRQTAACAALSPYSLRFASTAPVVQDTSTTAGKVADTIFPPPNEDPISITDVLGSASDPAIERHYGYLKELGLDFGWGPTAFNEWVFEHIQIGLGLPWWASIALLVLALRVSLFKLFVGAADTAGRLAIVKPHIAEIQSRIKAARLSRDIPVLMQASQDMRMVYKNADIKMWKMLGPFIQIPFGFGVFRLIRNMVQLPVPGLEVGGLLWFYDLTVVDPTYLLPLGTGVATFFMFKLGGEAGQSNAAINPMVYKTMQYFTPVATTVFMSFWPAALQMTFCWTSMLALTQSYAFKQAAVRNFLGIQPLPDPAAANPNTSGLKGMVIPTTGRTVSEEPQAPKKNVFRSTLNNMKGRGAEFVAKNQEKPSGRRSAAELAAAKRYEEKRRKEIEQEKAYKRGRGRMGLRLQRVFKSLGKRSIYHRGKSGRQDRLCRFSWRTLTPRIARKVLSKIQSIKILFGMLMDVLYTRYRLDNCDRRFATIFGTLGAADVARLPSRPHETPHETADRLS